MVVWMNVCMWYVCKVGGVVIMAHGKSSSNKKQWKHEAVVYARTERCRMSDRSPTRQTDLADELHMVEFARSEGRPDIKHTVVSVRVFVTEFLTIHLWHFNYSAPEVHSLRLFSSFTPLSPPEIIACVC